MNVENSKFFGELQPYIHHSNTPATGINLYSFAVEPEKHQPTGTSNFSKIENIIETGPCHEDGLVKLVKYVSEVKEYCKKVLEK